MECSARESLSMEPTDSQNRPLPATLTCRFLTAQTEGRGAFYPGCALGTADDRARFAEHRASTLRDSLPRSLTDTELDAQPQSDVGVLVADDSGHYVAANLRAAEMLGYSRGALLARSVWDLTPEPHRSNGRTMWANFIAAGIDGGRYDLLCADGTIRQFDYLAAANVSPGLHVSILRRAGAADRS